MRSYFFVASIFCSALPAGGCQKSENHARPEAKAQTATAHAPASAKAGSHEDWCGEHRVLESQCTLCNPSLSAAFMATGDWCAEHGLPESHCRKCNPNLTITRPAKPN